MPVIGDDYVVLHHPINEHAVKTADALQRTPVRLAWILVVDDGITAQNDSSHFTCADTVIAQRP